jgi:thiamine-phosphate pyrophosphorylase
MKCDKQNMLLYAVTDRAWVGKQTLYEQVESALKGGVTCVQLREKELDDEAFLKEAVEIHALCQRYGVPFFVNDNVDIAIRCHAEGVHVGQEDMAAAQVRARVGEGMMIGVSVHSVEEALEAVKHGADCLGVGAAFATHTKTDVDVLPHETLKAICDAVDIPVVAIGGIHKENILQLKGTGGPCECHLCSRRHRDRVQRVESPVGADHLTDPAANRGHHLGPRYKIHGENQHEKRILRRCRHPERSVFSE